MSHIATTARVGPDGILELRLPLGPTVANQMVSVTVETTPAIPMDSAGWHAFIDQIAGSVEDPTFKRQEQGSDCRSIESH